MDLGQGFIDTEAKLNVDRGTCTLACFWACWWLPANGGQGGGGVHSCMTTEERCWRIHTHTQVHTNLNTPPPNTHTHTHTSFASTALWLSDRRSLTLSLLVFLSAFCLALALMDSRHEVSCSHLCVGHASTNAALCVGVLGVLNFAAFYCVRKHALPFQDVSMTGSGRICEGAEVNNAAAEYHLYLARRGRHVPTSLFWVTLLQMNPSLLVNDQIGRTRAA